ncbi:MAG: putative porin [Chitinophagaceae bacterium]
MLINKKLFYFLLVLFNAIICTNISAQVNNPANPQITFDSQGRPIKKQTTNDSLTHRNPLEDSITIFYRYFDSTRPRKLDSSINDFYTRYPVPYYYVDLGNFGNAAHSLLFNPVMKPGWNAGFHAYDIYRYTIEDAKFFQTTRPYTELAYLIGSKAEQMVNILHTQNRKSNLNFTFEYRFINSPGSFQNQNANDNNIRLNGWYQSTNKRYGLNFIYISNKLKSSENGGIVDDKQLDSLALNSPFEVQTRLSKNSSSNPNPFSVNISTGTIYTDKTILIRQYYDLGQKDSTVTDSITYKLFYPRIRFQHTFTYSKYTYTYQDFNAIGSNYLKYFNYNLGFSNTVRFQDRWLSFTNEFSIISFPEKNNVNQFLKLSAALQTLSGAFDYTNYPIENSKNIYVSGEYRNRTRNQKWDVEATGQFFATGNYTGDYAAYISLKRQLSKKLGSLEVGFQNVNRTPSFVTENIQSSFPDTPIGNFNKENIIRLFATINIPELNLDLAGNYYAVTNYVYFDSFFTSKQQAALFNVLDIGLEKKFALSRHWNWYTEVHLQQTTGNPPVSLPLLLTRNRIAFEGNFFTNLFLSTGIELRYYSPYHPDNYSPLTGQFFYQNNYSVSNRPDVNVYLNFRIKSFKGFVRLENLNSLNQTASGVAFLNHNFSAPHYPVRSLWFRLGIWWNFVN